MSQIINVKTSYFAHYSVSEMVKFILTRQAMYIYNNTEAQSRKIVIIITQHACTILYHHQCPEWLKHIFPHYLIICMIFGKKILNIKCVSWFYLQLLFEIFLILRGYQWDMITYVQKSSCKVPIILVRV